MSIGYVSQKSLNYGVPPRRFSNLVSYSQGPIVPGSRRYGSAASLTSLTFSKTTAANTSSSIYKFGTASLNLSSPQSQISYANYNPQNTGAGTAPGGWPTGTGDYCVESWVYIPSGRVTNQDGVICALDSNTGFAIRFGNGYSTNNFNNIQLFARSGSDMEYFAYTWPINTWVHWAAQRRSGVISVWANGNKLSVSGGSGASSYSYGSTSGTLVLGSYQNNTTDEDIMLYIDEFCMSSSWRYDDSLSYYNVPTAPFTVDNYTRLLFHFDGSYASAAS